MSALISVRRSDRTAILDVAGDIDLASSPEMRKALLLEVRENRTPRVICNLSRETGWSSTPMASPRASIRREREMLGVRGLAEIVREAAALPLPQMKEEILSRVAGWRAGSPADDMSLVLAEVS